MIERYEPVRDQVLVRFDQLGGSFGAQQQPRTERRHRKQRRCAALSSKQEHARVLSDARGECLAEVGVSGHDDSAVIQCGRHDRLVGAAEQTEVTDMHRVVARVTQENTQTGAQALVDEKSQADVRSGSWR